jgi:hypothetical protein
MKIEQLIVQYLYSNKKVTLQDIGTFTVSTDINIPTDSEKDTVLPDNAIDFSYNPKAGVDDGLIAYIVENTRKIKPLATSDLESFIILNKQFLNIGKPLVMEGLGTLQKTQAGDYAFTQSSTSHVMMKEPPKVVTEKLIEKVTFATPPKEKNSGKGKLVGLAVIGLLVLGALSFAGYYLFTKNKGTATTETEAASDITQKDTTATVTKDTATSKKIIDTSAIKNTVAIIDTNSFYIVVKEYQDLAMAQKRLSKLISYGNKLVLTTKDSITYKMKMPFKLPLIDTLRAKDSLSKFFQAKTYVELP